VDVQEPGRGTPGAARTATAEQGGAARSDHVVHDARDWRLPSPPPPVTPLPQTAAPRPSFRPLTIRTARDAVDAAALYLRWLGFHDISEPESRPGSPVALRGPGVVVQVDPTTSSTTLRSVECMWLYGLHASALSVVFSLAGYTEEALACADRLGIPLFVMDLTGTPQPVNTPAGDLVDRSA
jgi:hypothetical protein